MNLLLNTKIKFPQEDQARVEPVAAFVLSFIQALLKTGYYQGSHPGSTLAKRGLYQEWVQLEQEEREISFVIADQTEHAEIFLYGIFSEVTSLKKLFSPNMAELFIPKLRQYFERRDLMSFTLKPGIEREEFDRFIDMMTERPTSFDINQNIAELTEKLVANQIVHVSVVYFEEMLQATLSLHWMSKMVLTRLSKDIRMVPLYQHLTEEQMVAIKLRLFRDVIHPISNTTVLKEILLHLDMIPTQDGGRRKEALPMEGDKVTTASPYNNPLDFEGEFSRVLSADHRWNLIVEAVGDLKAVSQTPEAQRLTYIIKKIIPDLSDEPRLGSEEVIETLLQEQIITLDALPKKLAGTVLAKRKMEDYLQNKGRYWATFQQEDQTEDHQAVGEILIQLLMRDDFFSLYELLDQFHRAFKKGETAVAFIATQEVAGIRELLVFKLQARRLEKRKDILLTLEPLAEPLHEILIPLCAHEDLWLRRNICRVMATVGEVTIPALIAFASEPKQNWQVVRNIVMILGDIGSVAEDSLSFLRRCQQHPHIRVREEVINSYGKMHGSAVEGFLLQELENPDVAFQSRVVFALRQFQTVNEQYLTFLRNSLKRKKGKEVESDESLQLHCCFAIESISILNLTIAQSFEPMLHDLVDLKKPFLGLIGAKYHETGYEVKKTICRLLGLIGTEKAGSLLTTLLKEKPWLPEDQPILQQAIEKIAHRSQAAIS